MTFQTDSLRRTAAAVCSRDGVEVTALPADVLLVVSDEVARVRRDADVLMAVVAAEISRRSETGSGVGLAVVQGFRSAQELVAKATGGSVSEARRLIAAGDLLAEAANLHTAQTDATRLGVAEPTLESKEAVEPSPLTRFRCVLAEAVREGRIGVEVSAVFTTALSAVPDVERTSMLFLKALAKADGLPLSKARALVAQAQALADVKAWEAREERQYEARSVTVRDDADGMVTVVARLAPLAAAPVRAVLDAGVRWAMRARRDDPESDTRTPWQIRADILVDLCRHALDCTQATTGVKTTVVIRINKTDLETGLGVGEIDGVPQPVSASALRHAAVDARIIPVILDGESRILDWGREKRHFTPDQRLALVERDGGCAWCNAPPSWCDAHHIRWWERDAGPTDLDNGVLMCERCHHRIHRDGWEIELRDNLVHFIPPPWIDPARTPRLGGRERYSIAA